MNLTKDKLKSLWNKQYYKKYNEIAERFKEVTNLFNEELKNKDIMNAIEFKPSDNPFGPAKDGLTKGKAFEGIRSIAENFFDLDDQRYQTVIKLGSVLGGFDFKNQKMKDQYRIISNSSVSKDDYYASLTSQGQSRHPSSHFADNNYFFNVIEFIDNLDWDKAKIVLRYPGEYLKIENDDEDFSKEYKDQKNILEYRFPPKFLWMWANKDIVIHPISLMAFRNFLNSELGKNILKEIDDTQTPESITNMKFEDFIKNWEQISNETFTVLDIENKKENIQNLSKLISLVSIEETDIKNISDLLQSGNKAVILWGPPGTGKTYESMEIVKELLEIDYFNDEEIEKEYLFSKQNEYTNKKGYYEIVQFHPNYTYQDFIGGISPNIDGKESKEISYILRDGIFKKFCDEATKNENQKFIFIIDEINRAELSAVFGELLYALEYRGKLINLPHFGEFTIPKNVYIIGTMNNVDKSLVTFDLALRRRFGFFKLMPKLEVIQDVLSDIVDADSLSTYYEKCKTLNKKIKTELDLGEDYQIGQAYFLKIKDFLSKDKDENSELNQVITSFELEKLWVYNIEPLLEEYLGMNIKDENVVIQLKRLKEEFLKDN
jgi:hypothetical protein